MSNGDLNKRNGMKPKPLTTKQQLWLQHYFVHLNAVKAAKLAGYACPKSAACKLMAHPKIQAAIRKAQQESSDKLDMDRDRLLHELAFLALRDPVHLVDKNGQFVDDLNKMPEQLRRCIDGFKVRQHYADGEYVGQDIEIKLSPKLPALELAMRHFGLLAPQEHTVRHEINWEEYYEQHIDQMDPIEQEILRSQGRVIDVEKDGNGHSPN